MATANQRADATIANPFYVFTTLSVLGFIAQWVLMLVNGTFVAILMATWRGVLPRGQCVEMSYTGIWPIDFTLALLAVFFEPMLDRATLPDLGPMDLIHDLAYALNVCALMALVEGRRNTKTGPLRFSSLWPIIWGYCGAASILPLYFLLYIKHRVANGTPSPVPRDQAQALTLTTTLWILHLPVPLVMPQFFGVGSAGVQLGVIVWFFAPLLTSPIHYLISATLPLTNRVSSNPVVEAYTILGVVSAFWHLFIASRVSSGRSGLSWSRLYLPDHSAVIADDPSCIREGSFLFVKYGWLSYNVCVLALGLYTLRVGKNLAVRPMVMLFVIMAIGGPGAGLAWLLIRREREIAAAAAAETLDTDVKN